MNGRMSFAAPTSASRVSTGPRHTRPDGVELRFWQPDDTPGINALYNDPAARPGAENRGPNARTDAQWAWEFAHHMPQSPPYVLATRGGRVVGTQAYIPIELLCDGKPLLSGKDEDTLVHPEHRGRGVLDDMYRLLLTRSERDGIAMLWGFTSTAIRPLLRNGFQVLGSFYALRAELNELSDLDRTVRQNEIRIEPLTDPDNRCDDFSLAFGAAAGGITLHLSADFLRWRVLDNPFREHAMFAALRDDRILGLGVYKIEERSRTGYISDLVAVDDSVVEADSILNALLSEGLRFLRSKDVAAIEARPSGDHPYNQRIRRLLSSRGFRPVDPGNATQFMVRPIVAAKPGVLDMARWRITELMREY